MRKFAQSLQAYFKENKLLYVFMGILFLTGIAAGFIVVNLLNEGQTLELKEYIEDFLFGIGQDVGADQHVLLNDTIRQNMQVLLLFWFFGITMFGVPFIAALTSLKGFTLGFTISFLFSEYSLGGLVFALVAVAPQNIILIPSFLSAAVISMSFSLLILKSRLKKKKIQYWQNLFNYTALFFMIALLIVAGSLVEALITPVFIRLSLGII